MSTSDVKRLERVYADTIQAQLTLYEELVETYHQRHPYFLVRIAQLYSLANCPSMALKLYQEAKREMGNVVDSSLDTTIQTISDSAETAALDSLAIATARKYYQSWKPTAQHNFPLLPQTPEGHSTVHSKWRDLVPSSPIVLRYLRKLAIEANQVESTFLLTRESIQDLVRRGISAGAVEFRTGSALHDSTITKSILNDTLAAYELLNDLTSNPESLNHAMICKIHTCLMKTARFRGSMRCLVIGHTRSLTRKSVLISGASYSVGCCPYSRVDKELDYICNMTKQWIKSWRNPFATASWIHLVLVRCHPFEDGNGRLTRLLASIPLMKAGYPPISISLDQRGVYYNAINRAYDGDHKPLIECILRSMQETLVSVEDL